MNQRTNTTNECKFRTPILLLSSSILLLGCGGGSSSDNAIQPQAVNQAEIFLSLSQSNQQTTFNLLNKNAIKIEDHQQKAPYLYQQRFDRHENNFNKSLRFIYSFQDKTTDYELLVNMDDAKTQQKWIQLTRKTAQGDSYYDCNETQPCKGINFQLDEKTGKSKIEFNNTYLYHGNENIQLKGYVIGELAEAPTTVKIPTSLQHQLQTDYNLNFTNPYRSENLNYQSMKFTNHNEVYLSTDFEGSTPIEVYVLNNQVRNAIYYGAGGFLKTINWAFDASLDANNPPNFDPKNYIVTFNKTKLNTTSLMNTPSDNRIIFMNGTVGP
ncbi:hypothetical protein [Acinetobacter sp. Marseille-Q1618]|uniref:hypothetical protein n=1 Tax=Acinetobacter sp. Marseille-Q1618 TaxID=2697502 RepID=UPI00156D6A57|nr:hypothetical protein [Acinetobacter sp. Marseille-Q1618]